MATIAAAIAAALVLILIVRIVVNYLKELKFSRDYGNRLPIPVIGHSHLFYNVKRQDILDKLMEVMKPDRRKFGLVFGRPTIWYYHPEPVEEILSSNEHISKSGEYVYLQPWLGTGLLTSTHKKWRTRRKLLTPAFHFRILDDALHVFNEQGKILADCLLQDSQLATDHTLDIFPYATRCTLDIILETSMGQQLGIQTARQSE